jgi:plastocyanin domain-containing protein
MRNPNPWTRALFAAAGVMFISTVGIARAGDDMGKMEEGKKAAKNGATRIEIAITDKGFEPNKVEVKRGEPVELVFTRKTDQTCIKEVILYTGTKKIDKLLPLNKPTVIKTTFTKAGDLKYACNMNMFSGTVSVQ